MTKTYKCCVCKKTGGWDFSFFHHFTPKMKERYQCINCRFDHDPKAIAIIRTEHKVFKKQIKFLDSLTKIK
jgi:hypothetical protein